MPLPEKATGRSRGRRRPERYPVSFAYTRDHRNTDLIEFADGLLSRYTPQSVTAALRAFEKVLENNPRHVEARLGKIHCSCLMALYIPCSVPKPHTMQEALTLATLLSQERPDDWRAHYALAAVQICKGDCVNATRTMETALSLEDTDDRGRLCHLWLASLFFLTGRRKSGVRCALITAVARAGD